MNPVITAASVVAFLCAWLPLSAAEEVKGEWSEAHESLAARICLVAKKSDAGLEVLAYLELRNTTPPAGTVVLRFPLDPLKDLSFTVRDADGKEVEEKPIFCSTIAGDKGYRLEIPQDGLLRFCISQNGGGVFKDKTLLYLQPGMGWYFDVGDKKSCELAATLTVAKPEKSDHLQWSGTLKIPAVKIPVPAKE